MKNIKINAICNALNSVVSMLFPLITFTYASRCLGVEAIGKYSYSNSIVDYYVLLAGLGIETYAIREGAGLRDDKDNLEEFSKEITSINFFTAMVSYLLLFVTVETISALESYKVIILIISTKIFFTTIGRSWLLTVYEDYVYQTIRSIALQVLAICFLFLTVKSSDSLPFYAMYCIFGTAIGGLCNCFYGRKYCKFELQLKLNKKHIKPILYIFATAISAIIYTSSDTTILGMLTTDYHVGLYAVSVKIYTIVRTLIAAVMIVSVPRFSYYLSNNMEQEFHALYLKALNTLVFIAFPAILGIALMSKEIVWFVAGETFLEASRSLSILSLAMLFNILSYVIAYGVMIPLKQEKRYMYITIISALINIVLNFILIPYFQEGAAALTTVISEIFVLLMCSISVRKYVTPQNNIASVFKILIGCIGIFFVCIIVKNVVVFGLPEMIISIAISAFVYIGIEMLLRNEILADLFGKLMKNRIL